MRLRLSPTRALLLTGTALALVVSACGSDSTSSSTTAAEAATTTPVAAQQPTRLGATGTVGRGGGMQEAITAFTACLGEHGVTVPDVDASRAVGATAAASRRTGGSMPAARPTGELPGQRHATAASPAADAAGNGGNFNPVDMIVQRLGLDTSDATVKAAVDACTLDAHRGDAHRGTGGGDDDHHRLTSPSLGRATMADGVRRRAPGAREPLHRAAAHSQGGGELGPSGRRGA